MKRPRRYINRDSNIMSNTKNTTIAKSKGSKRSRLSKLLRKALSLWTKCVKERDGYTCQLCGARNGELNANGKPTIINAHHIISRRCKALRLDVRNGITLCAGCHKFSPLGPHRGMLIFSEWLRKERPGLTEYLLSHTEDATIESETQMQLEIDRLKEELNAMSQV